MSERQVVKRIETLLNQHGAWWVNLHGSVWGRNGLPDLIATYHGQTIAIEAKAPGGQATRLQLWELDQVRRAGGLTLVTHDPAEVKALLDTIDQLEDDKRPA